MSGIKNNWALITTYKVMKDYRTNFRFMETFLNFYEQEWGIGKFILLIGVPEECKDKTKFVLRDILKWSDKEEYEYVDKFEEYNLPFFSDVKWYWNDATEKRNVEVITYKTNYTTPTQQWDVVKRHLFKLVDSDLERTYDKVLNIDNDEFLRLSADSKKNLEIIQRIHFHYIDHVAQFKFQKEKDMKWCLQPWYYRINWGGHEFKKVGLKHGACKIFWFNRDRILTPWEHSGKHRNGSSCNIFDSLNLEAFESCLGDLNIGYHLACLDRQHYVKGKAVNHKESQTEQTAGKKLDELRLIFEKYYYKTNDYPVFVDNFLKKYWGEKDG